MNKAACFINGFKSGIPIALGYFAVSFTFGMMAVSSGLSLGDAVLISATNLTSAGQFAGLSIIVSNGSCLEMMLSQFVINLRYSLMSFALSQKLDSKFSMIHRFLISFGVTDEIFALSVSLKGKLSPFFNYGVMSVSIPGWVFGTFFGALLGNVLPFFVISSLSLAIYGMFIAIIIPPSKKDRNILYVVISSMFLSSLFRYLPLLNTVSSGFVVIICTVVVSLLASIFAPIKDEGKYE